MQHVFLYIFQPIAVSFNKLSFLYIFQPIADRSGMDYEGEEYLVSSTSV
jgi:hypothetical protein